MTGIVRDAPFFLAFRPHLSDSLGPSQVRQQRPEAWELGRRPSFRPTLVFPALEGGCLGRVDHRAEGVCRR